MPARRTVVLLLTIPAVAVTCLMAACGMRGAGRWAMDRYVEGEFDDVRSQSTVQVAARLGSVEAPLLLDIREPGEFAVSHIPGAINVPPSAVLAEAIGDVPRDRPVVVYCSVGWRSAEMARRMSAIGYRDVTNMQGSIFRWVAEGRPLEDGQGRPAGTVHAFGPPWSWLVAPDDRAAP